MAAQDRWPLSLYPVDEARLSGCLKKPSKLSAAPGEMLMSA